jgi:hypothetical protein
MTNEELSNAAEDALINLYCAEFSAQIHAMLAGCKTYEQLCILNYRLRRMLELIEKQTKPRRKKN